MINSEELEIKQEKTDMINISTSVLRISIGVKIWSVLVSLLKTYIQLCVRELAHKTE